MRATWRSIAPRSDAAALLFYDRLFEIDPTLAPLFSSADPAQQRRKLVAALTIVAEGLDVPAALVPAIEDLGRRHVGYGVTPAHYERVGQALLWTLEKGLGPDWTPDASAAWADAYALLAKVMKEAGAAGT